MFRLAPVGLLLLLLCVSRRTVKCLTCLKGYSIQVHETNLSEDVLYENEDFTFEDPVQSLHQLVCPAGANYSCVRIEFNGNIKATTLDFSGRPSL